jgi:protein gp37
MSDLFQPDVPDDYIVDVVKVMVEANWHIYQVLTKRSERLRDMLLTKLKFAADSSRIWWGVSVEDRKYGVPRVAHLKSAPAAIRFLSIEPLLEEVGDFDISGIDWAIVGGESGNGARRMAREWVEGILHLCRRHKVKFFFKQWGGVRKSTTGRLLHGRTYDEMPQVTPAALPEKKVRAGNAVFWENRAIDHWSSQPQSLVPCGRWPVNSVFGGL